MSQSNPEAQMDFDQLRKTLQALSEQAQQNAQAPSKTGDGGEAFPFRESPSAFSTSNFTSLRQKHRLSSGTTMIVNYLSLIVFLILSGIGWVLFGKDLTEEPRALLMPTAWFVASWLAASAIKLAAQWERVLVFRLGKFHRLTGPGVYGVIPLLEQIRSVDTRVLSVDIPRQEAITRDNVPIAIDGVVFLRVVRPDQAVINVQDYMWTIVQYARAALRDVIGGRTLDEVLTEREGLGHQIEQMLIKETEHWGLEVDGIRIQDIILPEELKKVMSRQASAEREKRANITKSEGDRLAADNLAAAAHTMMESPGAMQLRTLQTIDGLGPTASNTVVLAVPVEVMEAASALAKLQKGLPSESG
ncbi:MAG: SPFH domain-containing protein [Fimbriimonadaceae bacterium]|nr:SPFH domain-containing protein [Fimbriimonadaceae bacterium]